jgi:hypothetical protein
MAKNWTGIHTLKLHTAQRSKRPELFDAADSSAALDIGFRLAAVLPFDSTFVQAFEKL